MPAAGFESPPHPSDRLTSRAELVAVLRDQHAELREALARLPDLSGAARDDEFLHVRRQLAVHEALESVLVGEGEASSPDDSAPAETIVAAERLDTTDRGFEAAARRVLRAHQRHAERAESVLGSLSGDLTPAEQSVVETAMALWVGEGDAYPGHDYRDMLASANAQLQDAAQRGHGPRP